jgi:hypothetical protein
MLVQEDGPNMVAWLDVEGDARLEVSYCPDNYPALNVRLCTLTDGVLAAHVLKLVEEGWTLQKCNVSLPAVDYAKAAQKTDSECPLGIVATCPHAKEGDCFCSDSDVDKRAEQILQIAIDGLREYYPHLNNPEVVEELKKKVIVPDTGDNQADYEATRDAIEKQIGI